MISKHFLILHKIVCCISWYMDSALFKSLNKRTHITQHAKALMDCVLNGKLLCIRLYLYKKSLHKGGVKVKVYWELCRIFRLTERGPDERMWWRMEHFLGRGQGRFHYQIRILWVKLCAQEHLILKSNDCINSYCLCQCIVLYTPILLFYCAIIWYMT